MDAKLKLLKVVDLKAILSKANVQVPAKANKSDLIAKIIASKPATDVYNSLYPSDDLLATPEDVDWSTDQLHSAPGSAPELVTTQTKPTVVDTTKAPSNTLEDAEAEKRRKRAARFGIPLVESSKSQSGPIDKLNARAARFGTTVQKSSAISENVDQEEAEKRRKRAERFGITPVVPKV